MSNKLVRAKTRKPTFKDKMKGSINCFGYMVESLLKGNIEEFRFGYILLKETIAGKFEVVIKEK